MSEYIKIDELYDLSQSFDNNLNDFNFGETQREESDINKEEFENLYLIKHTGNELNEKIGFQKEQISKTEDKKTSDTNKIVEKILNVVEKKNKVNLEKKKRISYKKKVRKIGQKNFPYYERKKKEHKKRKNDQ